MRVVGLETLSAEVGLARTTSLHYFSKFMLQLSSERFERGEARLMTSMILRSS